MNKLCKRCGASVSDEASFCSVCGGNEFTYENPTPAQDMNQNYAGTQNMQQPQFGNQQFYGNQNQNPNPNPNQNPYQYNQPNQPMPGMNQPWQPPVDPNKKKKKNVGLIIGIIIGVLVILTIIGGVVGNVLSGNYVINNNGAASPANYSTGTLDGNVYTADWADIKFMIPDGYANSPESVQEMNELDDATECGIYVESNTGEISWLYICYEKLPAFPKYDETKYLDDSISSLNDDDTGVTATLPDSYTRVQIAGQYYLKADCLLDNGAVTFTDSIYVRKVGDYMVVICAISESAEANEALMNCFVPAD